MHGGLAIGLKGAFRSTSLRSKRHPYYKCKRQNSSRTYVNASVFKGILKDLLYIHKVCEGS